MDKSKALISTLVTLLGIFIVFGLLDKIEVDVRGTDNLSGTLDNVGITFINLYNIEAYNIGASIAVMISVLYLIFVLANKKPANEK
ncbi:MULTISPECIES: hypothetical protein [Lysinibacillus]|uniref:hypothetical protein n=1 Tax=Lysinibacillus TaxID=400634 RepID=UPI00083CA09D|nr:MULTISPECIES: hypothetical protein [Lysinibacillus]